MLCNTQTRHTGTTPTRVMSTYNCWWFSFERSCSATVAKSLRSGCRGVTNGGCSLLALNSSVGALQTNSIHSIGLGVSSSGPEKLKHQSSSVRVKPVFYTVWK